MPTWPLVRRLVATFLRPYFARLGLAMVFMAIAAATPAIQSELMQHIVDDVFTRHDRDALLPVSLAVLAVFVARGVSVYINSVTMNDIGQRIVADIQRATFRHLMLADLAFFHRTPSGELISRMTADIGMMRTAVAEVLTSLVRSTLTLAFLIFVMFQKDWQLALISFAVFPLAGIFVSRLGKRMRRISGNTQAELASFSSLLSEIFQSMRDVKAYGMEAFELDRAGRKIDRLYKLTHRIFRVSAISQPVSELLSGLAIVTLVLYGGHEVIDGHRSAGQLFAFITAFLLAYEPLKRAGKLNGVMQTGLASAERVFAMIDLEPSLKDRPDAAELILIPLPDGRGRRAESPAGEGGLTYPHSPIPDGMGSPLSHRGESHGTPAILLDRVSFRYGSGHEALADVTIEVPAGKTVALVGPSGAGKSTVLNLIPRFYDVTAGAVLVGGQDVRGVTLRSLRGSMALVSQNIALFDDTVAANILYGREGASEAEIEAAARAAAAHDFIMSLPKGYQTTIGENGVTLSGGQRQRLSIARAMLRDAPILLLDEATSALDAQSERAVQAALVQLRQGRTTLVIAHRLSTIMDADIIYVMEEGRVIETGTHAALLRQGGLYSRLYGMQDRGTERLAEA